MLLRWHQLRRSLSVLHRLALALLLLLLVFLCAQGDKTLLPYDNAVRLSIRFNTHRLWSSLVVDPLRNDRWLVYEAPAFPLQGGGGEDGGEDDVGIVLKTGYGTRERAVAWLEALPTMLPSSRRGGGGGAEQAGQGLYSDGVGVGIGIGNVEENVVIVGDFEGEVRVSRDEGGGGGGGEEEEEEGSQDGPLVLKVHDVIGEVLQCEQEDPTKRSAQQQSFLSSPRGAKYRTLRATIAAGEDALARNLSRSFGWELDAMKFIPALDLALRTMPHKKWYLLVDDDTYLIQPSLRLVLGHLDPDVPHYLGNAVGDYRQRFAHGGSAIALSRAAMHALLVAPRNAANLARARRESLTETWGDRLLARALLRLGIHLDEGASRFFNGEPPWAARLRKDRFCVPVTAFHRLASPSAMRAVGRVLARTRDPVLWVDLWALFGAPGWDTYRATPVRREWDHVGALKEDGDGDEQTRTTAEVTSAVGCWTLCQASRDCLAWTWETEGRSCHMSPWITVGSKAEGKVSGLHVERATKLAQGCL